MVISSPCLITVRRSSTSNPRFSTCCSEGKVVLPFLCHPLPLLTELMDYTGGERSKFSSGVADNNLRSLVQDLIKMLDIHNPLVQSFRMAKDRFLQSSIQLVTLRLIGTRQHTGRQYNLPTASKVVALIPGDGNPTYSCDVIVKERVWDSHIFRWAGLPDLFVTMTCNPQWPEIQRKVENCIPGQPTVDRPDTIACVFKMKLDDLMDDISKGNHFGRVKAVIYTIEFQKRRLSHCHALIFLHEHDKISSTDEINHIISAVFPSEVGDPIGYEIHYRSVAVERLIFHEEGCNRVYFRDDDEVDNVIERETTTMSKFTEWMKANEISRSLVLHTIRVRGDIECLYGGLNPQQRDEYDNIMQAVNERNGGLFFIYGCRGTGKTYLWKTIISWIRSLGRIVLSVASSGIASLLLPGRRTAHSRFRIPMELDNESCCGVTTMT
ncbi:uncharacterized protein Tco_0363776 [Tanacetum coccineum]